MIAMVSSITHLLCASAGASYSGRVSSNLCATVEPVTRRSMRIALLPWLVIFATLAGAGTSLAQQEEPPRAVNRTAAIGGFLGGIVVGFGAHESGHLVFDAIFDADPGIKRVEYHGIPFFAITHRSDLPPRQEYTISAAGF